MQAKTTRILLATASAAAMSLYAGGPAFAADPAEAYTPVPPVQQRTISGTVDLFTGHQFVWNDSDGGNCTSDDCPDFVFGGEARVDVPFGDTFGIQLDATAIVPGGFSDEPDSDTHWLGNAQGGVHVYSRQDRYLFGVFAGGGRVWTGSSENIGLFFAGAEGQYHFNSNMTLYGQAGFVDGSRDDTEGQLESAGFLRGVGRYFFNSGMTKAEAEVAYIAGQADNDDAHLWAFGAEVEHQVHTFANGDGFASVFARYEGKWGHTDDDDEDTKDQRVYVGIKLNMNQMNLQGRNLNGDTLDLPDFGAWVHAACSAEC